MGNPVAIPRDQFLASKPVPKSVYQGPPQPPTQQATPAAPVKSAAPAPTGKYDTALSPQEETSFQAWKKQYAPNDSGDDYDLRGAFKANLRPDAKTGHWPDTFKKPNHPTFSNESMYAKEAPDKAGHWNGETYIPPAPPAPKSWAERATQELEDTRVRGVANEQGLIDERSALTSGRKEENKHLEFRNRAEGDLEEAWKGYKSDPSDKNLKTLESAIAYVSQRSPRASATRLPSARIWEDMAAAGIPLKAVTDLTPEEQAKLLVTTAARVKKQAAITDERLAIARKALSDRMRSIPPQSKEEFNAKMHSLTSELGNVRGELNQLVGPNGVAIDPDSESRFNKIQGLLSREQDISDSMAVLPATIASGGGSKPSSSDVDHQVDSYAKKHGF